MNLIRSLLDTLTRYQSVRVWFIICAGPALSLFAMGLVAILVWGGWPKEHFAQIISYVGIALEIVLLLIAITLVALTRTSFSGKGPGGVAFDIASGKDDDMAPPQSAPLQTATATVTLESKQ